MGRLGSATRVAVTAVLTLLVAAGAYASIRLQAHPAAQVSTPSPVAKLPAATLPPTDRTKGGYDVWDADMVDETFGAVLASDCDVYAASTCRYYVATTVDGAQTWSRPVQVGPTFQAVDGDAPRMIRLASRSDGFVFGHSSAFVTHDGGKTWKTSGLPGVAIADLTVYGGRVWVATYPCKKGTLCPFEVRSSTDAGRTWSPAYELPLYFSPEIAAFATGAIVSSTPPGDIKLTTDQGMTWRDVASPCHADQFRGDATTPDGIEIWMLCKAYPDASGAPTKETLYVSEDAGRSWKPTDMSAAHSDWVVSPRPHVAFASGRGLMAIVTRDSGSNWSLLSRDYFAFITLRFKSATSGWGWSDAGVAFVTTDGGQSFNPVGSIPSKLA